MPKKGHKQTKEHREAIVIGNYRRYKDLKEHEKSSVIQKEVQNRSDVKAAISAALTGVPKSPEHKAAIKESHNTLDVITKCREAKIANLNPNWKGGIGKLPYPFNFNFELKKLIRERDIVCQLCGKIHEQNGERLCIHHIDYDKDNLDPKNLIALCRSCNTKVNYNREYWLKFFKSKIV